MRKYLSALIMVVAAGTGCAGFWSGAFQKSPEPSTKITEARRLTNGNNYAAAVAVYRTIVQEHPNTEWAATAKYGIALVYASADNPHRDYSLAIAEFDEFLAQYPLDQRVAEARSWRQALKVILDMKRENDRLNMNMEKLKQLDMRQEQKRLGR